jgi:hypothetical protein
MLQMVNIWYNPIMDREQKPHKITVDIPQGVWEAIRALAQEHHRSFVKELVWALQEYVKRERRASRRVRDEA